MSLLNAKSISPIRVSVLLTVKALSETTNQTCTPLSNHPFSFLRHIRSLNPLLSVRQPTLYPSALVFNWKARLTDTLSGFHEGQLFATDPKSDEVGTVEKKRRRSPDGLFTRLGRHKISNSVLPRRKHEIRETPTKLWRNVGVSHALHVETNHEGQHCESHPRLLPWNALTFHRKTGFPSWKCCAKLEIATTQKVASETNGTKLSFRSGRRFL